MNNLSSYCGLVDEKIRASEKDLLVPYDLKQILFIKFRFSEKATKFCDIFTLLLTGTTGKSLSEAFILASTNPQYDDRLFIELQVQYMKIPTSSLGRTCCEQKSFLTIRTIFVHNMFSQCSAKRRASNKDFSYLFLNPNYSKGFQPIVRLLPTIYLLGFLNPILVGQLVDLLSDKLNFIF